MAFLRAYPMALSFEKNNPMTRMSWGKFKMTPAKRVKRCDMSTSKFTTIDAFFINVNKSSVPAIVPEQSESASFDRLVEIHNVDVPASSNRDATVLYLGSYSHT